MSRATVNSKAKQQLTFHRNTWYNGTIAKTFMADQKTM